MCTYLTGFTKPGVLSYKHKGTFLRAFHTATWRSVRGEKTLERWTGGPVERILYGGIWTLDEAGEPLKTVRLADQSENQTNCLSEVPCIFFFFFQVRSVLFSFELNFFLSSFHNVFFLILLIHGHLGKTGSYQKKTKGRAKNKSNPITEK